MRVFLMLLVVWIAAAGCIPEEVTLEGRPCPCVSGYVCVDNVCLANAEDAISPDGGGSDSSVDGLTEIDSAVVDATFDAIRVDAGVDGGSDGSTDSGAADAAPLDAGDDAPIRDAGTDAPVLSFCDRHGAGSWACLDFDDGAPSGWSRVANGASTLAYDSTRSVGGQSLRISVGNSFGAFLERRGIGSVASGTMWYRVKAYVRGSESPALAYIPLFSANQEITPNYAYASLSMVGGRRTWQALTSDGISDSMRSTATFRADSWFCVEVRIDVAVASRMIVYLDGVQVSELPFDASGRWDVVRVGAENTADTQPTTTVWLDDFVWSPARVPCSLE